MRAADIHEINYHLENDAAFLKAHEDFFARLDRIPMPEGTAARFIVDDTVTDGSCLFMFINTEKGFLNFKSEIKEK